MDSMYTMYATPASESSVSRMEMMSTGSFYHKPHAPA
jgi:hypothetical protein